MICDCLKVIPSAAMVAPSSDQVTVVVGPPVDVHVSVREDWSYPMSVIDTVPKMKAKM